MLTVVCGLLEEDPKVRMSVGEAHRALASDQDAARTDPAPYALAGVEDVLSSKAGDGSKGSKLHAKMATLMLLHQTRQRRAAKEQGPFSPRIAAQLLSKAGRAKKRARS